MTLMEAIAASGMTPPRRIVEGRFVRFPGIGKGRANRAGWCKQITPTLAIFGDFSSNLSTTWCDSAHRDTEESRRLLEEARRTQREAMHRERQRWAETAEHALYLLKGAKIDHHPYLELKGFADHRGLVSGEDLLIPVRDLESYDQLISLQTIKPDGTKRFLKNGRTRGGIYRLGSLGGAKRIWLCEGYATGLSIEAGAKRLPGPHVVIVCFSAGNLEYAARKFPEAMVCADHDLSGAGERAARNTGLKWAMPTMVGDYNDLHQQQGLHAVTEALRSMT